MNVEMYSVYDKKTKVYQNPMFSPNRGTAIRDLHDFLHNRGKDTMMAKYPDDYQLTRVGCFDEDLGQVEGLKNPDIICDVNDLLEKEIKND